MEINKDEILEINNKLNLAYNHVVKGEINEAKTLLGEFLEKANLIEKSENEEYSFRSIIEFILFVNKKKADQKIIWTAVNFSKAYNLYAYICNEEKKYDEALSFIDKAIKYNPMDANSYFEKAESFKAKGDFENMLSVTLDSYDVIYDPKTLARYYRNLGYYYIEDKKYDIAYALYTTSTKYEPNKSAFHEMGYINHLLKRESYDMSFEEATNLLKDENIIIGALQENVNILYAMYKDDNLKEKDKYIEENLENLLFGLTRDKVFSPFIEIIDEQIGYSVLIPKKWEIYSKEKMVKENIKENTKTVAITDTNSIFQIAFEMNCADFNKSYNANILNIQKMGFNILKQAELDMKAFVAKQAITEYEKDGIKINMLHNFIKYKDMLLDFSITLDNRIKYSEDEQFLNQKSMIDMYNVLTTLIFKE